MVDVISCAVPVTSCAHPFEPGMISHEKMRRLFYYSKWHRLSIRHRLFINLSIEETKLGLTFSGFTCLLFPHFFLFYCHATAESGLLVCFPSLSFSPFLVLILRFISLNSSSYFLSFLVGIGFRCYESPHRGYSIP